MGSALWWWLVVQVVAGLATPLCLRLFRPLADRGYGLSKAFGLLLFGYAVWLLGVLRLLENGLLLMLVALLLVGGGSYLVWRRDGAEIAEFWRRRRGLLLLEEAIFLGTYLGFLVIRSHNPDIAGTEKFMDFAFMNAVTRSSSFPPLDPWLAPSPAVPEPTINYYHFGYLIQGLLLQLSGVHPATGFNLALGLLFGLAATGIFSLGYGLARDLVAERRTVPTSSSGAGGAVRGVRTSPQTGARRARRGPSWSPRAAWPYLATGAAAVYMLLVAGNLWAALRRFDGSGLWEKDFWQGIGWNATRVLVIKQGEVDLDYTINEFPVFSFLLGDLHPHVLALPFAVLAIGLAYAWLMEPPRLFRWAVAGEPLFPKPEVAEPFPSGTDAATGGAAPDGAGESGAESGAESGGDGGAVDSDGPLVGAGASAGRALWRERTAPFAEVLPGALLLGSLYFLNSWDFPAYFALAVVAGLGGAWWQRRRSAPILLQTTAGRVVEDDDDGRLDPALTPPGSAGDAVPWERVAAAVVVVGGLAVALFLPFHLTFRPPVVADAGGVLPLGLVVRRSLLSQFLQFWGAQLLLLAPSIWLALGALPQLHGVLGGPLLRRARAPAIVAGEAPGWKAALVLGGGAVAVLLAERIGSGVLVLCLLVAAGAGWAAREALDPTASGPAGGKRPLAFAFGAICLGALLLATCEVVHIRDFYGGALRRMNTVFKFYYQAWLLFAAGGSVATFWLLRQLWARRREPGGRLGLGAFGAVCVLLFGATLLYPWRVTLLRTESFKNEATLDGMEWMRRHHPEDRAAAEWLRENAATPETRAPVVLEATGGPYSEFARMATQTGLPTVLGWDQHERLWRGAAINAEVDTRARDVDAIYTAAGMEGVRPLLEKYDIAYIVVGYLERQKYGTGPGLAKFDGAAGGGLEVAFRQGQTTVYRVTG